MRRIVITGAVALTLLGFAASARAQDSMVKSMQNYLDSASSYLNTHKIAGAVRFSPFVSQGIVYDDNIWLNDKNEPDTRGRVGDFVSDTTVRLGLLMPTNPDYSQFLKDIFGKGEMNVLTYEAQFLNYFKESQVSSIGQHFTSDLFGLFRNLGNADEGRRFTWRVGGEYSDISDPIDVLVRNLKLAGFPAQGGRLNEIRRRAADAHGELGFIGNQFDAKIGYRFDWEGFTDPFFRQADQIRQKAFLEAGITPQILGGSRVYGRISYRNIHYRKELLNDADVYGADIGFKGNLIGKKLFFVVEGGFLDWQSSDPRVDSNGKPLSSGDRNDYRGGTGLVRVAYEPFPDDQHMLRFQLEGQRTVDWSAISNYRVEHIVRLTAERGFTDRIRGDITLSWSHYVPSEGPIRTLYEAGAGINYYLFGGPNPPPGVAQVVLHARYLFRLQSSTRESFLTTTPIGYPNSVSELGTDGDFYQNVFSVGIDIKF